MTTLMRNGRDRRSGKPVKCHARKERALLVGTRSANHIRAGGHSGCTQRPDTWLHPNASRKRQIPLASRAPSKHGTKRRFAAAHQFGRFWRWSGQRWTDWLGAGSRTTRRSLFARSNSLFLEKNSLIRVCKFPVPLRREFG